MIKYGTTLQSKPDNGSSVKLITVWQGHLYPDGQYYFVTPHGCVSRMWSETWILDNYEEIKDGEM